MYLSEDMDWGLVENALLYHNIRCRTYICIMLTSLTEPNPVHTYVCMYGVLYIEQ